MQKTEKVKEIHTTFKCALCSFSTKFPTTYKNHVKSHSTEKPSEAKQKTGVKRQMENCHGNQSQSNSATSRPFPCPHPGCKFTAKKKSQLLQHSKIHSAEKSLFCTHPSCKYSTLHKQALTSHTRLHTGEKPFVCPFESCSYATAYQSALVTHTRNHTKEKPFKCSEANCGYSAAQSAHLRQHQLNHHPKEGAQRPSFSCALCEYSAKTQGNLASHILTHTLEKYIKCDHPNCSYKAKRKDLKIHKLVHSQEKPFACPMESCGFRSKFNKSLSGHLKTHSDEKRYKCELCPYRAKGRAAVRSHINLVHFDKRPFKCSEQKCDYAAKTNQGLKVHLSIHKGDKKYACSFPNCTFRSVLQETVKSHEHNIHSEEKREKCTICLYKCKTKSQLTMHVRIHTKEKPFVCKENGCEYRATQSSHLKRHVKVVHA